MDFFTRALHFRSVDAIGNALARLSCILHWWNPLFYFGYQAYRRSMEMAADDSVKEIISPSEAESYASFLIDVSSQFSTPSKAIGALGIQEGFHQNHKTLQQRIQNMINPKHSQRNPLSTILSLTTVFTFLALSLLSWSESPSISEESAEKAALQWIEVIDQKKYAESYNVASKLFQEAVTQKKWIEALESARTPIGKVISRQVASKVIQKNIPTGATTLQGTFCIIQIESSYEKLKNARETVTFELEKDGVWRASGYYIRPN